MEMTGMVFYMFAYFFLNLDMGNKRYELYWGGG